MYTLDNIADAAAVLHFHLAVPGGIAVCGVAPILTATSLYLSLSLRYRATGCLEGLTHRASNRDGAM